MKSISFNRTHAHPSTSTITGGAGKPGREVAKRAIGTVELAGIYGAYVSALVSACILCITGLVAPVQGNKAGYNADKENGRQDGVGGDEGFNHVFFFILFE